MDRSKTFFCFIPRHSNVLSVVELKKFAYYPSKYSYHDQGPLSQIKRPSLLSLLFRLNDLSKQFASHRLVYYFLRNKETFDIDRH